MKLSLLLHLPCNSLLQTKLTYELMFFIWKNLRKKRVKLLSSYYEGIALPNYISVSWFKKVSHMVWKGKYNYSTFRVTANNLRYSRKKRCLKLTKLLILEMSFVYILKPLFMEYTYLGNYKLKECLRKY